jgi:nicotinamide-nucleotide amidase
MVQERVRGVAEQRHIDVAPMLGQARRQALLPRGARLLPAAGVAPGAWLETGGTVIVVLPGVPGELEAMWPPALEQLVARSRPAAPQVSTLRIYGVGEMQVVPVLEPFVGLEALDIGVTASFGEITVRATARGEEGRRTAAQLRGALAGALPVYSADGQTLDELLAERLRAAGTTVATAESCTGGLLGARLTDLAGSSDYFLGGVIGYANEVKVAALGVPEDLLAEHGAVSEAVALAMAAGVRRLAGATYGLSTTGVAGPGGGTPAKPVGLVFLGIAGPDGARAVAQRYPGDRDAVRRWAVNGALHLLRRFTEAEV